MKNNVKRQHQRQQHQQHGNSTIMNIASIDNTTATAANSQQIDVDENNSTSNNKNNAPQHLEMESSSFDDIDLDLVDDVESNVGGIGDYTTNPTRKAKRFYYCLPMMVQYRYAIMFISLIFLFLMVGIGLLASGGGADPMIARLPTSPATAPTPTDEEIRETMGTLTPTTPFPSPAPSEQPEDKPQQQQWFQTDHPDYVQLLNTHDIKQQSHLIAGLFCNEQGLHLCNYNEYCPDGKMNAPSNGGPLNTTVDIIWNTLEEVQWAPINSATNINSVAAGDGGWVQVGYIPARDDGTFDNGYGICWTWNQWAREDEEDLVQVWNENHRQWILCCPQ